MILCIDTALEKCSISLCWNGECIDVLTNDQTYKASEVLHILIEQLLAKNNIGMDDLKAVAVNGGPGSYTGLRIGATAAKGLCYALDIPLININGLRLMTEEILERFDSTFDYYIPMIDARRIEVFTCIFDQEMNTILPPQPKILTSDFLDAYENDLIVIYGNGGEKAKELLNKKQITFVSNVETSAKYFKTLAWNKWLNKNFENNNTYAPKYLKKFHSISH